MHLHVASSYSPSLARHLLAPSRLVLELQSLSAETITTVLEDDLVADLRVTLVDDFLNSTLELETPLFLDSFVNSDDLLIVVFSVLELVLSTITLRRL